MAGLTRSAISRRDFLRSVGVSLAAVALSACARKAPAAKAPAARSSGKVQLVYQDCRCRGQQLKLQDFYDAHPNIEVFYTPDPDNFEGAMLADFEAGTAPDLMAAAAIFFPCGRRKGTCLTCIRM